MKNIISYAIEQYGEEKNKGRPNKSSTDGTQTTKNNHCLLYTSDAADE